MKTASGKLMMTMALILMLLTSMFPSCANPASPIQGTTPPMPPPATQNQTVPSPDTTPDPTAPISVNTSFPDGAPPLNHDARLVSEVRTRSMRAKNIRVEIILPEAFEVVSGNLSAEGDVDEGKKVEFISAVVRAVKKGSWAILTVTYIDPKEHGFFGTLEGARNPIYVSISENSSEWRVNPPYDARLLVRAT